MNIVCTERNRNLVVKINGEIDHHSAEEIRDRIERDFARSNAKNIIFDLANVGFMDSSGIGMIIGRYKQLEKQGGRVFAINISGNLNRIFEISGLKKIIGCYDSLDDAVNANNGTV